VDVDVKPPWSAVTHIETKEGRRGGRRWWLTLSCGHFTSRSIPKFDAAQVVCSNYKVSTAPHKVKCLICKLRMEG
jgi:hypothetical protein